MKFKTLIKVTPFLISLLLTIFLGITNSKQNTNVRILIWNTPSLTLGTYLAISCGSGFILSYLITTSLARTYKSKFIPIKYKEKNLPEEQKEFLDINGNSKYDNTLIERDIKDPSPTVNANFRIIGKTERTNNNFYSNNYIQYEDSAQLEEEYDDQPAKYEPFNKINIGANDWDDESYSSW